MTLIRGAARTDGGDDPGRRPGARRRSAGMGWTPEAPAARGQTRDRWESLQALVAMAEESAGDLAAREFVADLDRRAAEQHAPAAGGVTLATLHAAKGLEWDAVFLAGMHDGAMPLAMPRPTPRSRRSAGSSTSG